MLLDPKRTAPPPLSPPLLQPCDNLMMLNWVMYTRKYGKHVYEAVQLILICPVHRKLALCGEQQSKENQKFYLHFNLINHGHT
ncbi:hypothetical protein TYRP_020027 [Tyrophagus putrescentiae]|nr:hypothetical protein TYRP_020027 [Tyrophagus putrescentiae]